MADNERIIAQLSRGGTGAVSGLTATGAELNVLDDVTAGTVSASLGVVVDSNKDIGAFRNVVGVNFDAGASATAGTVDIFPTTAAKGKIAITAADSAGNTTTTIVNASQSGARTYTIPDGGASASFVLSEGASTLNGARTFGAAIVPSAGIATAVGTAKARLCHTGAAPPQLTTSGNDSTPSVTETYYAELFVPCNMVVTGISTFNGSATGSGNITAYLLDSSGAQVSGALTASTAISGTDAYQRIPFTPGTVTVLGPATYFVATQYNNTATRFNTHTFGDFSAGKTTGSTYGTLPAVTPAATFTTALGPMASLY